MQRTRRTRTRQSLDGSHEVARHSPDLLDQKLLDRIDTGYAPDGVYSPTPDASRFSSYEEMVETRAAGMKKALQKQGSTLDARPPVVNNATSGKLQHMSGGAPRKVGEEFRGVGPAHDLGQGDGNVGYADADGPFDQSKTKTAVVYDSYQDRWKVAQHTPVS
jgi:hypothetical protein